VLTAVLLAAAVAWADAPGSTPESQRAQQLRRNRDLIRMLVEGGLSLAGEEDPLQRATFCNGMAEQLANAVKEATDGRDTPRAVEIGRHLHQMLSAGVAVNLSQARGIIPEGSSDEKKLYEVRDHTNRLVGLLEEGFQPNVPSDLPAELTQALEEIRKGRTQVEKALKDQATGKRE
jgi:hypothetical protein